MTGVITAILRGAKNQTGTGFGFIRDEENQERFFHVRNVVGDSSGFEALREGQTVTFDPITVPGKGLRADRVC